jgi:hypothetical protein
MRAIVPHDIRFYSYAWVGYANPHAVTGISYTSGGTTNYVYDNNGDLTSSSGNALHPRDSYRVSSTRSGPEIYKPGFSGWPASEGRSCAFAPVAASFRGAERGSDAA